MTTTWELLYVMRDIVEMTEDFDDVNKLMKAHGSMMCLSKFKVHRDIYDEIRDNTVVRRFIEEKLNLGINNFTPYDGDDGFQLTVWPEVEVLWDLKNS